MQAQSRIKLNSAILSVMGTAALKAARKLIHDFSEVEHLQVSKKGPGDFVSTADRRSEKTIRQELEKARPGIGFLLEEGGVIPPSYGGNNRFIVDPLDGTTNFLHGIPHFAISIAFEQNKDITAGIVYDPLKDEMFYAVKGMGAYVNNRRLRVSGRERLSDALMGLSLINGALHSSHPDLNKTRLYLALAEQAAGMRRSGSAALDLCYIAAGRLDTYYAVSLAAWDVAAAALIIREAGGSFTTFPQSAPPAGTVLAANGNLYPILLEHMTSVANSK